MSKTLTLLALLTLAACGADGDPLRPSLDTTVRITPDGVRTSTGVSVSSGPVSVRVGL